MAFVRPNFRDSDWNEYKRVNARFAEAVANEAKRADPVILVQDYHFALLPSFLRKKLPNATIITFWHIPWPNPEIFGICPWKEEIIAGLFGSSVIGFHTQFHCNNFLDTVDRFIEARIDREQSSSPSAVWRPLSGPIRSRSNGRLRIEGPKAGGGMPDLGSQALGPRQAGPARCWHRALRLHKGHPRPTARRRCLPAGHPEWKNKFVFIQVAAPSRSKLPTYSALQSEAAELARDINARHGDACRISRYC